MNLKTPINENYAATVVRIKNLIPLEGCNNILHTIIFGNHVIIGKEVWENALGIFFPVETQLSGAYMRLNNLFRDSSLNADTTQKGYFEESGRVKCVKLRGHKSEGLFMPLNSLLSFSDIMELATLKEGDTFDHINGVQICKKFIPAPSFTTRSQLKSGKFAKKVSKIVEGQFQFHVDTSHFGKNIHKVKPDSIISISNKLHGSSFIVSKILVKRTLNWFDKILKLFGVKFLDTEYDMIYSSRKVIKNDNAYKNYNHYYKEDIWKLAADKLKDYMPDGMTIYGEIVGFTPSGEAIQKGYDYGCVRNGDWDNTTDKIVNKEPIKASDIYIYRITYTNTSGKKFEFSAKQVQDWCKSVGFNPVPQYFYGYASELISTKQEVIDDAEGLTDINYESLEEWQNKLLEKLKISYNMEKDCELCKNKVPAEGIVVRIEGLEYDAYKLKSFRFKEHETKQLDKGEIDIETKESEEKEQ